MKRVSTLKKNIAIVILYTKTVKIFRLGKKNRHTKKMLKGGYDGEF